MGRSILTTFLASIHSSVIDGSVQQLARLLHIFDMVHATFTLTHNRSDSCEESRFKHAR
jgi:hypothetical protein